MIYVTSDLHGYPLDKFRALLDSAGFSDDDFLFVLGDVIDRNGDGGIAMLRWMMLQSNVQLIAGNHEDMLCRCRFLFDEVTDISLDSLSGDSIIALERMLLNGAKPTLDSLKKLRSRSKELVDELFEYLMDAPLFETVEAGGRDFLLTHAGLGNFRPRKKLYEYSDHDMLWNRPRPEDRYYDNVFTVFGHTPTDYLGGEPGKAFKTDTWIDIDTGAAAPDGAPMLLRLDDMREFYVK